MVYLNRSGVLSNLHGNCLAAADTVSAMLLQSGIERTKTESRDTRRKTRYKINEYY